MLSRHALFERYIAEHTKLKLIVISAHILKTFQIPSWYLPSRVFQQTLSSTLAIKPHGTEHKSRTPAELGEVFPHGLGDKTDENPSTSSTADALPRTHRQTWTAPCNTRHPTEGAGCLGGRVDRPAALPKKPVPANTA